VDIPCKKDTVEYNELRMELFYFVESQRKRKAKIQQIIIMLIGGLLVVDPKDHDIFGHVTYTDVWVNIAFSMMQFFTQV